jgi:hypothetical protein
MKTRNIFIICLIVVGIALFGIVYGILIPQNNQNEQRYIIKQQDPLTHNIESVLKYKNKYMGNASNVGNLFHALPLNNIAMSCQLFPDTFTVEVKYNESVSNIGEAKVNKSLIYNATAAFSLIDNLNSINFIFNGVSYIVLSSDVEKWYGVKVYTLTEKGTWEKLVQSNLDDNEYVLNCTKVILQKIQSGGSGD